MNDRFRFRVWDKNKKFMIYDAESDFRYVDRFGEFLQYPEDYEVMQCTRLKDNNGNLIYEGDIVKIFHVSGTMQGKLFTDVVEWNELRYRFDTEKYGVFDEDDTYEVIGNIYENKELLQESEVQN